MSEPSSPDDLRALRAAVRGHLARTAPMTQVRAAIAAGGFDRAQWSRMAAELRLPALPVPTEYGGDGAGLAELVVVMEELGRSLFTGPYLSGVVLASAVLVLSGDERAGRELLPPLADGSRILSVAAQETDAGWDAARFATQASHDGGAWQVSGVKAYVADPEGADGFVVFAQAGAEGPAAFLVGSAAPGVRTRPLPTLDQTRPQGEVWLTEAPARLLGRVGDGAATLRDALAVAGVALAAEQAGGARRCLESAVAYAKTREAFGGVIGGYQAVKHLCADMWLLVSGAEAAVRHAAALHDADDPGFPVAATIARIYSNDAYLKVAADSLHVHGGIGFTWEHDAHLHLRRAHADAVLLQSSDALREELLARLAV